VRRFEFDNDKLVINAVVRGSEDYDVSIYFNECGDICDYECTCPAYYSYSGACKHIVAVMKMAQSELLKYKYYKYDNYGDSKKQGKNTIEDLFAFLTVYWTNTQNRKFRLR